MPAHSRARLEAHEAERLRGRRVDDLPDVDPEPVAELGQLVDESDVDGAKDVLQQLRQLRRLRGRDDDDLVADLAVELAGALCAALRQPSDQLRSRANRVVGAAGVDALRGEGEVEVASPGQAGLLENGQQPFPRRPRIGGRLQHHQLLGLQDPGQRAGGIDQKGQIGLTGAGQRRRHADDHRVTRGQIRIVGAGPQVAGDPSQRLLGDVLDIAAPLAESRHLATVAVQPDDLVPLLGEGDGKRQADVAEPDHADLHAASLEARPALPTNGALPRPPRSVPANCGFQGELGADRPHRIRGDEEARLARGRRDQCGQAPRLVPRLSQLRLAPRKHSLSRASDHVLAGATIWISASRRRCLGLAGRASIGRGFATPEKDPSACGRSPCELRITHPAREGDRC